MNEMQSIDERATLEEASGDLLGFITEAKNWVALRPGEQGRGRRSPLGPNYERQVGPLRVSASVDVQPDLQVLLRVAFRSPNLEPVKASEHLEAFLKSRMPLVPRTEWQVEVDERKWIHFFRPYVKERLKA